MNTKLKKQLDLYEKGDLEALESILTPSVYNASNAANDDDYSNATNEKNGNSKGTHHGKTIINGKIVNNAKTVNNTNINKGTQNPTNHNVRDQNQSQHQTNQTYNVRDPSNYSNQGVEPNKNRKPDNEPVRIIQGDETVKSMVRSVREDGTVTMTEVDQLAYPELTDNIKSEISNCAKEWIKLDDAIIKLRVTKTELERQKKIKESKLLNYIEEYGLKDITKGKHQLVPQIIKGKKQPLNKKLLQNRMADFLSTLEIGDDPDEIALQACDYLENMRGVGVESVKLHHTRL